MEAMTVHPQNREQSQALEIILKAMKIPFEKREKEKYNPDFVAKIQQSRKDYKEGKGVRMTPKEIK